MGRLTDNDRQFGPITYGRTNDSDVASIVWSSAGKGYDGYEYSNITVYMFGWILRMYVWNIIKPFLDQASGDYIKRKYGFRLSDTGFLQVYYGVNDFWGEKYKKCWNYFLPWTQWRHIRQSVYDDAGELVEYNIDAMPYEQKKDIQIPSVTFKFEDYDGKVIVANTIIEEREWRKGTKWCKWLSWFVKPVIRRSLNIAFSEEVGPEKGSWKGGIMGHSIDMLPGELHDQAFRRYCDLEHSSKHRTFKLKFIEQCYDVRQCRTIYG